MTTHSRIGASSMHRWDACPGSVALSHKAPPAPSSIYADEGTKAHEVAAHFLLHGEYPKNLSVDVEMAEAVMVYIDTIYQDERRAYGKSSVSRWVEHKFDLSKLHPGLFGTADCVQYFPALKLLRVYDYKHGIGIAIDVEDNSQLKYYGLGALLTLEGLKVDTVELVIVQPRCPHTDGPVRRFQLSAMEMLDFSADLIDAAKRTEDSKAPLVPGDHCRFCPAAGICPQIHEKALTLAKEEFRTDLSYDPTKLGQVLHWLPTLEAWIKSVREFAYGEAQHGRTAPGWKLVQKRQTRRWKDAEEARRFLGQRLSDSVMRDCITDPELRSVAQVEKILGKNKDQIAEIIVSESSGYTLAPESDKREPVRLDAKSEFQAAEIFD